MYSYKYITRKDAESYRVLIREIIHEVQDLVRDKFTFRYDFIGSSARNMITYDPKTNKGFDLDVNIEINYKDKVYSAKEIKEELMKAINKVVHKHGFGYCENSTRVITIKQIDFWRSKVIFSCDFAVVNSYIDNEGRRHQQYIEFNKKHGSYTWKKQSHPYYLEQKIKWIKKKGLWNKVLNLYLEKKNNNSDINKKSRSLYAETINEICQKNGYAQNGDIF